MRQNSKMVRKLSSIFTAILSLCREVKRVMALIGLCSIAFPATFLF